MNRMFGFFVARACPAPARAGKTERVVRMSAPTNARDGGEKLPMSEARLGRGHGERGSARRARPGSCALPNVSVARPTAQRVAGAARPVRALTGQLVLV